MVFTHSIEGSGSACQSPAARRTMYELVKPMNIIDIVPSISQIPKRAMSRGERSGRSPPAPSRYPWPGPAGPPAPGRGSRRSRISLGLIAISVAALAGQRRLVLHHVILRGVGVPVLVRPPVDGRDLARPVPVRGSGRGRPLEAVGVPRVLGRPLARERAPEEVHEEQQLRGAEDDGAHGDELVDPLQRLQP